MTPEPDNHITLMRTTDSTGTTRPTPARRRAAAARAALWLALPAILLISCSRTREKPFVDPVLHEKEIRDWQVQREQGLTTETGWLTLVGLGWLSEGGNTIGSDSTSTIVTPAGKTPARLGTIFLRYGKILFRAAPGVEVLNAGRPVKTQVMEPDDSLKPTILGYGTVTFYVIRRGDKLGVRVKDSESDARKNFAGLEYFPTNAKYRVDAKFVPYSPPKILEVPTQAGTIERDSCPGALEFELDGVEYSLDAVIEKGSEDKLFLMFADATNGIETYGPGRQLYAPLPDREGYSTVDFNRAYNWPCVFTVYSTCPLPPEQNRLPIRIEAGEKMYHGGPVVAHGGKEDK